MDSIRSDRNRGRLIRLQRWAGNVAAIGLLLLAAWSSRVSAQAAEKAADLPFHSNDIAQPLDPLADIDRAGATRWRAAVALLPDPIETRLGRSFDIQVSTLMRSMQFNGYVLQGHALPWQLPQKQQQAQRLQEALPGVLVFRRDGWRGRADADPAVEYFVMFLVGESPVFGVQRMAFCRASVRAARLNSGQQHPQPGDLDRCDAIGAANLERPATATAPVDVLGPMFSGSMTSLAEVALRAGLHLRLLSPSATVSSNRLLVNSAAAKEAISYQSFATWQQDDQLRAFFDYLFTERDICPADVVVLAEQSSFGQGAQDLQLDSRKERRIKCAKRLSPQWMPFPQNIAAIRAEHAQLKARNRGDTSLSLVPNENLELDMQDAGESLDLPPVYQPSLTSRSDELSLQQLMDLLSTRVKPRAVLVVATDVRDRLYMLDMVRRAVPAALPAVLEGDHLLAHPDYRSANRGTLMLAHTRMQLCYRKAPGNILWQEGCRPGKHGMPMPADTKTRRFAFATDYAAGLFRANQVLLYPQTAFDLRQRGGRQMMYVVTLAGLQSVQFPSGGFRSPGTLIAADWRLLSVNFLVPLMLTASALLVFSSMWLWRSSRPGRTILPPIRHALREIEWWTVRALPWRWHEASDHVRLPPPLRRDQSSAWLSLLLCVLSLCLFAELMTVWLQLLSVAHAGGDLRDSDERAAFISVMRLVHGRDPGMAVTLFGLYAWMVLLMLARVRAWNHRCAMHWNFGEDHPARYVHMRRSFHGPSLALALMLSVPLLLGWCVRGPVTVDATWLSTGLSFLVLLSCVYFLVQGLLQAHRVRALAQDVRLWVLEPAADLMPRGWPSPQHLGISPRSPLVATIGDRDWQALSWGGTNWPRLPPPDSGDETTRGADPELRQWRARTVAEVTFGLVTVRSCLWAGFLGPVAVLLMIHVHPFAFEWEHSLLALAMMVVALAVSVFVSYRAEQTPLIAQMFTQDGARVSIMDLFGALGSKVALAAMMLVATVSPDLGQSLQKILSMLKF